MRSYANMMAHLGQDFNFYVITRDTDYCATTPYASVTSDAWNTIENLATVYYCSQAELNTKRLTRIFKDKTFDVVYINGMYSWYFSILPLLVFRKHTKVVVAARGMLNTQAFSVKPLKKKLYLALAKRFGLFNSVCFHATNDLEQAQIGYVVGKKPAIQVAPNLPRFLHAVYTETDKKTLTRFVNVARISVEKGTLKLLEAFKRVTAPVVLDLYGPIYDMAYWAQCQKVMAELPAHVVVTYKGIAESDAIPELLKTYDFFMMLSEGENFGHAILEAFSAGLPVIISDKTPWVDLKEKGVGWDVPTHDLNMLSVLIDEAIYMDADTYKVMSRSAYDFAKAFSEDADLLRQTRALFLCSRYNF